MRKRLKLWVWWLFHGRDRLDMAWSRIEKLEQQNSKLSAALLAEQNKLDALNKGVRAQIYLADHSQQVRAEELRASLQAQIDVLRNLLTSRADTRPAPHRARNWREVQEFTQGETTDVAAS